VIAPPAARGIIDMGRDGQIVEGGFRTRKPD